MKSHLYSRQTPEARKESLRKYRQSEKGKACQKRYLTTEKGKASSKRRQAKYHATQKGKETRLKVENKRRRKLGFIKLFPNLFDESIKIHWHHVTDNYVIALPAIEHDLYGGKTEQHREKCWCLIEKYYTDDAGTDHQIAFV
jgi:hypothetical protein